MVNAFPAPPTSFGALKMKRFSLGHFAALSTSVALSITWRETLLKTPPPNGKLLRLMAIHDLFTPKPG